MLWRKLSKMVDLRMTKILLSVLLASLSLPAMAAPPEVNLATTLASLLLVIILILVLGWLLKRLRLPSIQGDNNMKIVKQLTVGQKERILLLQVGDEQLLVGVTQHNISLLNKLEQPLPEPVVTRPEFASQLGKILKNDAKTK